MSFLITPFYSFFATAIRLLASTLISQPALPSPPSTMQHIVIVGGSYAGVSTAHQLLKAAAATAAKAKSKKGAPISSYKVTLVSRDTHFFWNMAAPRTIVPGQIPDENVFLPLAPGFAQYGDDVFELVLGSAVGMDPTAKTIKVASLESATPPTEREIRYDYLVLATGSRTAVDGPFKSSGSTEATAAAVKEYRRRVGEASSIVVVGGGATGVETAGELGFFYKGEKNITLISSTPAVLSGTPDHVSRAALKHLHALGVTVRLGTKVTGAPTVLPSGKTELTLSTGARTDKLVADMYIPSFGIVPNSTWITGTLLDERGFVVADEFLRARAPGVFAIGDVNNVEAPRLVAGTRQATHMAKNLLRVLCGEDVVPYKAFTTPMMGLQIGKNAAAGHIGTWRLPEFLIKSLRKTLFVENLPKIVDGTAF